MCRLAFCGLEMQRFSQLEGTFEFNFRRDLPEKMIVYISIDGENYILVEPKKLVFS